MPRNADTQDGTQDGTQDTSKLYKACCHYFVMVRIEKLPTDTKVGAVMVDGFTPTPEEIASLPWGEIRETACVSHEYWHSRIKRHLAKLQTQPQEANPFVLYRNAVQVFVEGSHFGGEHEHPRDRRYRAFGTRRTRDSIEKPSGAGLILRDIHTRYLPHLRAEFRHDEEQGRRNYMQNVILYVPDLGVTLDEVWEVCDEWINALGFREKSDAEYLDREGFTRAWAAYLDDMTGSRRFPAHGSNYGFPGLERPAKRWDVL
jgi:hypothetical protein